MRALVRETRLSPDMFVLPLFVCEGEGVRREVPSMPGVFNLSVDEAVRETAAAKADGVNSVLLFGLPDHKDDIGSAPTIRKHRCSPRSARSSARAGRPRDHRRLPLRVHRSWALRIVIDDDIANDPTVDQLVRAAVSHAPPAPTSSPLPT